MAILLFLWTTCSVAQSISKLYEKANASVVLIKTGQPEIFGKGKMKTMVALESLMSGFIVSEEGGIMTASPIVQRASLVRVIFSDGEELPAKVLNYYPFADVALIKLTEPKSTPLSVATRADSDKVKIGDKVFLIGAPFGLGHSLSVGYVRGKYSRKNETSGLMNTEFIQTDAADNEGTSSSPLFNMKGEVIGIASFIARYTEGFQGISFAASSNVAQKLLGDEHPVWTGIEAYFISGPLAEILNMPQSAGILVQKVATYSLRDDLGLRGGFYHITFEGEEILVEGNILLALDTIPLTNQENLGKAWSFLQIVKIVDSIRSTILRKKGGGYETICKNY